MRVGKENNNSLDVNLEAINDRVIVKLVFVYLASRLLRLHSKSKETNDEPQAKAKLALDIFNDFKKGYETVMAKLKRSKVNENAPDANGASVPNANANGNGATANANANKSKNGFANIANSAISAHKAVAAFEGLRQRGVGNSVSPNPVPNPVPNPNAVPPNGTSTSPQTPPTTPTSTFLPELQGDATKAKAAMDKMKTLTQKPYSQSYNDKDIALSSNATVSAQGNLPDDAKKHLLASIYYTAFLEKLAKVTNAANAANATNATNGNIGSKQLLAGNVNEIHNKIYARILEIIPDITKELQLKKQDASSVVTNAFQNTAKALGLSINDSRIVDVMQELQKSKNQNERTKLITELDMLIAVHDALWHAYTFYVSANQIEKDMAIEKDMKKWIETPPQPAAADAPAAQPKGSNAMPPQPAAADAPAAQPKGSNATASPISAGDIVAQALLDNTGKLQTRALKPYDGGYLASPQLGKDSTNKNWMIIDTSNLAKITDDLNARNNAISAIYYLCYLKELLTPDKVNANELLDGMLKDVLQVPTVTTPGKTPPKEKAPAEKAAALRDAIARHMIVMINGAKLTEKMEKPPADKANKATEVYNLAFETTSTGSFTFFKKSEPRTARIIALRDALKTEKPEDPKKKAEIGLLIATHEVVFFANAFYEDVLPAVTGLFSKMGSNQADIEQWMQPLLGNTQTGGGARIRKNAMKSSSRKSKTTSKSKTSKSKTSKSKTSKSKTSKSKTSSKTSKSKTSKSVSSW